MKMRLINKSDDILLSMYIDPFSWEIVENFGP